MISKILSVARAEYITAVRSKAFLFGVLLMPLMMGGSIVAQVFLKDRVDLEERACAIHDPTGVLFGVLEAAVERRNEREIWRIDEDSGEQIQVRPMFRLELVEADGAGLELSRRVESGELDAFLFIDASVLDPEARFNERALSYHTDEPTFTELPSWIEATINGYARELRYGAADLDVALVEKLDREIPFRSYGLITERQDGTVAEAEEENRIRTFGVPMISMFMLFMLVMTSAPALMNQVLEEKMQRISEVLVSAVSPFQLMMGKLVGTVGVSLTLAILYVGTAVWALNHYELSHLVPGHVYAWFLLLLAIALLMYGSIFSALGSACSELRDVQSMVMPAMILILLPMFAWTAVMEAPNGSVARFMTFIPTATPLILLLRVAALPGPPAGEVVLSLTLCLATTVVFVWGSSKIFRIGILSQGQTPSFAKLLAWVLAR